MIELLAPFAKYLLAAVVALVSVIGVYFGVKAKGQAIAKEAEQAAIKDVRIADTKKQLKTVKEKEVIENEVEKSFGNPVPGSRVDKLRVLFGQKSRRSDK